MSAKLFYTAVMCSENINNIIHKVTMDAIKMSSGLRQRSRTRYKQSSHTKTMSFKNGEFPIRTLKEKNRNQAKANWIFFSVADKHMCVVC